MAAATSEDGLGGGPDTGSALMCLVSPGPDHIFVQVAHHTWVRPKPPVLCQSILFLGLVFVLVTRVMFLDDSKDNAHLVLQVLLVASSVCLLCRTVVYILIGWTWYLFDYCIVVNFVLIVFFWSSPGTFTPLGSAIVFVAASTLLGFNMVLKGKLLVHHWEAFSAFWLHVGTPWVIYILHFSEVQSASISPELGVMSLLAGFSLRVYCPWAVVYLLAAIIRDIMQLPFGLSRQPYLLQDIVAQVLGHSPPTLLHKVAFVAAHAGIAHLFAFIGCIAYHHAHINMIWLLMGTASGIWRGVTFYFKCFELKKQSQD